MTRNQSDHKVKTNKNSVISSELARKISEGDLSSSNEFVQINYKWLLFIIRNAFVHSNNHEDIVQDAFMLVISKLQKGHVKKLKSITSFLRSTAINLGYEYQRRDRKFNSSLDQNLLHEIKDAKRDILSTVIWNEKVSLVKQVMSELPTQRDKDILTMFYFNEVTKFAICLELELSSEHFDRVLYRARERLKQLIESSNTLDKGNENNNANSKKLKTKNNITRFTPRVSSIKKIIHMLLRPLELI